MKKVNLLNTILLCGICLFGCGNQIEEVTIENLCEEINCTINEHIEEDGKVAWSYIKLNEPILTDKALNQLEQKISEYLYDKDKDYAILVEDCTGKPLMDVGYVEEDGEVYFH